MSFWDNLFSKEPGGKATVDANNVYELNQHQKDEIRRALVQTATRLIGIPYEYGAEWTNLGVLPRTIDCSEMFEGVFKLNGLKMKDGSQYQFDFTVPAPNPKPGDLAFFGRGGKPNKVYHVGMVYDDLNIVEARGPQPRSSFKTGEVILRPKIRWENYRNFVGYRTHTKLA